MPPKPPINRRPNIKPDPEPSQDAAAAAAAAATSQDQTGPGAQQSDAISIDSKPATPSASSPTPTPSGTPAPPASGRPKPTPGPGAGAVAGTRGSGRLASLGSSLRGGGAARGTSSKSAPVVAKPKFAGRRSAIERAEAEREAQERRRKENEAAARFLRSRGRGSGRGVGGERYRGRGRGGYMGERDRRGEWQQGERVVEGDGPFSGGVVVAGGARGGVGGSRFGRSGVGGGSGSGGSGLVGMPRSSGGGGGGGGGRYAGSSSGIKPDPEVEVMQQSLKTEDGGYVSSDEEEEATKGIQRMNVDDLGVIDLTQEDGGGGAGQSDLPSSFQPVRLKREAHKERTLGLNADGATNDQGLARVTSNDAPPTSPLKRKGKARAKDVEITGASETFHGTYSSSDEGPAGGGYGRGEPAIKAEPQEEDSAVPAGLQEPPSPDTGRKVAGKKNRTYSSSKNRKEEKPVLQTQEEVEEWERMQTDLKVLYEELGTQPTALLAPPQQQEADAGDVGMVEGLVDKKADKVYLFQFPPVLPDLLPVRVKPDPDAAPSSAGAEEDPMDLDGEAAAAAVPTSSTKAKTGEKKNPVTTVGEGATKLRLPSGCVGKLRIRKSGKAELDWGGTKMSVGMGGEVSFLQDVVVVDVPEKKKKKRDNAEEEGGGEKAGEEEEEEEKGWAMSMGQVKGKFVVTPDWGEILG